MKDNQMLGHIPTDPHSVPFWVKPKQAKKIIITYIPRVFENRFGWTIHHGNGSHRGLEFDAVREL